ncbi:uncharacterized protein LOC111332728 isoform X2 [Stylophora pistillata]|uniref:uncharacterized protein LOC111332728 isoform X2 n=1 Tax=Stylophora pistillata TaxID=50429 RepID=UPI000C04C971|nr:uncharacterized protein LOC111332728 isoform X2 [Stylophora pistillata]
MVLQPFTNEQLNYFKFASMVRNEFAIALRQTFKSMWDNMVGHRPGYQPWDDSTVAGNMFITEEDRSEIVKRTFDRYVQLAKEAFKALGVKTDPIHAISGLTEFNFPTKEVRRLEESRRLETQAYIECLAEVNSIVNELRALGRMHLNASEEHFTLLEQKIYKLTLKIEQDRKDSKPFLPQSNLPLLVLHFSGDQRECEDISSVLTSKDTKIVSMLGSPGFGKTFVATTLEHQLHYKGLPVYFFSMRGLQSRADLKPKLLSFFRKHSSRDQMPQQMSKDDELF